MDKDDIIKKIMEDEDYIRCPKFSNSLSKFLAKNDSGVEDNKDQNKTIARLLMISEEMVETLYSEAIKKLREEMTDDEV